ncbi:MAG: 8-oxo-dGTP diphosphatase [Candidatus Nomurabacteria bacterium]|jgi:mutator protein MutT|nr:8-oxo-dGTP diphosphatase [Candidatus Nomurabacteria bacterium]
MKKLETTLLFLRRGERVLLAEKKRGFGEGKFNGIGGKLEPGETAEQAMIRETEEEIGVKPTQYQQVAVIDFDEFVKGEWTNVCMNVYVASDWDGEPTETEEMRPQWFDVNDLPYDKMFADDKYWLPLVLGGKKLTARFQFDEDWKMLSHEIKEENG